MGLAQVEFRSFGASGELDGLLRRCRDIAAVIRARASALDEDGRFPGEDIEDLRAAGLLRGPLRPADGGFDLGNGGDGARALMDVLRTLGAANLAVGRIYEGHVNALLLVRRYGTVAQASRVAEDVCRGAILGVWNAEAVERPVILRGPVDHRYLDGAKILASGAGHLTLPLVPVLDEQGRSLMVLVQHCAQIRSDLRGWTAQGMRASATGTVDLGGIAVEEDNLIGNPGDYLRQPFFSGGAWRFCAVQLGAVEALADLFREALVSRGRDGDPLQRARIGECAIAAETARLWVERAAQIAASEHDRAGVVAYVDLTRSAVERAALEVLDRVQRGVGLQAFMRPQPIERIARDLRTYLRQPAPDAAMMSAAAAVLESKEPTANLFAHLS